MISKRMGKGMNYITAITPAEEMFAEYIGRVWRVLYAKLAQSELTVRVE